MGTGLEIVWLPRVQGEAINIFCFLGEGEVGSRKVFFIRTRRTPNTILPCLLKNFKYLIDSSKNIDYSLVLLHIILL